LKPGRRRPAALRARFDRIFHRRTGFATLDRPLARRDADYAIEYGDTGFSTPFRRLLLPPSRSDDGEGRRRTAL
jgi:hypothetical protein